MGPILRETLLASARHAVRTAMPAMRPHGRAAAAAAVFGVGACGGFYTLQKKPICANSVFFSPLSHTTTPFCSPHIPSLRFVCVHVISLSHSVSITHTQTHTHTQPRPPALLPLPLSGLCMYVLSFSLSYTHTHTNTHTCSLPRPSPRCQRGRISLPMRWKLLLLAVVS